jgi:hypothetical protein
MERIFTSVHSLHICGGGNDIIGYIASVLVLATFSMTSMRSLRTTAIASNIAFIVYAAAADLHPILILHGILLPVNVVRLMQIDHRSDWRIGRRRPRRRSAYRRLLFLMAPKS